MVRLGQKISKSEVAATDFVLSKWREFGFSLLVFSFVLLEIILPRLDGGQRPNLPLFACFALLIILFNFRYLRRNLSLLKKPPFFLFFLYIMWLFASTSWSYLPSESMLQAGIFGIGFMSVLCFSDLPAYITARKVISLTLWVCVAGWIFLLINPQVAASSHVMWRLNGIMNHCQHLCLLVVLALVFLTVQRTRKNQDSKGLLKYAPFFYTAFIFLLVTLLFTKTRAFTTFGLLSIGGIYYLNAKKVKKIIIIGLVLMAGLTFFFDKDIIRDVYARQESNDETLTGRVTIWQKSLDMVAIKPLRGYGFSTFNSDLTSSFFTGYTAAHAHNAWINAAFEIGIIGTTLLTLFLLTGLATYWRLFKKTGKVSYGFFALLITFFAGFMGVIFGGKLGTSVAIVLLLMSQEFNVDKKPHSPRRGLQDRSMGMRKPAQYQSGRRGSIPL